MLEALEVPEVEGKALRMEDLVIGIPDQVVTREAALVI
jgi:hypothetical protein